MNKRVLVLISILALLITIVTFKIYIASKKELQHTYNYSLELKKTAQKILSIKSSFKPYVPRFCKFQNNKIICSNMDKNRFFSFQNSLKKSPIKTFEIKKEKYVNAILEIEK